LVYFQLVKAGYGSLREVKEMDVREVIQALHFEKFNSDYQAAYFEVNREDK